MSAKRRRCSRIKKRLANDLHNLCVTSADFSNDIESAKEDFVSMLKRMEERHSELSAQSLGLEEKYGEVNEYLKGGKLAKSSQQSVQLAASYSEDIRRLLHDTTISLSNHAEEEFKEKTEAMIKEFEEFGDSWNKKLNDLKVQADQMVEQTTKLAGQLIDFRNYVNPF